MEYEEHSQEKVSICLGTTKWHFLVLFGTAFGTILEGLIPHSFGTFIANFRGNTSVPLSPADASFVESSQFQLNWLPALSSAFPCILLPLFSVLIRRIRRLYQLMSIGSFLLVGISCILSSLVNQWQTLFFTYSLIYSIGTSIFLAVVIAILADYFPLNHRFHVLATSLYQIGYPTAALVGNPILASLIVQHGWRNALKYVALIQIFIGVFVGFVMKPQGQGLFYKKYLSENEPIYVDGRGASTAPVSMKSSVYQILRSPQFWPWLIGKYVNYMCWYGLRTNIVTYLVSSTTFGLERSARLMSAYAAAEIVIALFASLLGDRCLRGWLIHVHIIAAATMAIFTGIYSITLTSYLSAMLLMVCIGIAVQFSLSFGYPASVEVLNSEFDMTAGWIITNVAAGLGILTSPILSGLLMDKFYLVALFYAQCVGWTLQAVLFTVTLVIVDSKKPDVNEENYYEFKSGQ